MTSLLNTVQRQTSGQDLLMWTNIIATLPTEIQEMLDKVLKEKPQVLAKLTDALRRKAKSVVVNNQGGYERANEALLSALLEVS